MTVQQQEFFQLRDTVIEKLNAYAQAMLDNNTALRPDPILKDKLIRAEIDFKNAISDFESHFPISTV